jgi:predicted HicB family RNase H-like nuclease
VPSDDVPFALRLPPDLYEEAKKRAAEEDRSLNQLIRVALRDYLARAK